MADNGQCNVAEAPRQGVPWGLVCEDDDPGEALLCRTVVAAAGAVTAGDAARALDDYRQPRVARIANRLLALAGEVT